MFTPNNDVLVHDSFGDRGGVGCYAYFEAPAGFQPGNGFEEGQPFFVFRYSLFADGCSIQNGAYMTREAQHAAKAQMPCLYIGLPGGGQRVPDNIRWGRDLDLFFNGEVVKTGNAVSFQQTGEERNEKEQGDIERAGFLTIGFIEIPFHVFERTPSFSMEREDTAESGYESENGEGHDPADLAFYSEVAGNDQDDKAGKPRFKEGALCGMPFPVRQQQNGQVADKEGNDKEERNAHDGYGVAKGGKEHAKADPIDSGKSDG